MAFLFGFLGAFAGLLVAVALDTEGLGFFIGAFTGGLLGSWINLKSRLSRLEARVHDLHVRSAATAAKAETHRPAPAPAATAAEPPSVDDRAVPSDPVVANAAAAQASPSPPLVPTPPPVVRRPLVTQSAPPPVLPAAPRDAWTLEPVDGPTSMAEAAEAQRMAEAEAAAQRAMEPESSEPERPVPLATKRPPMVTASGSPPPRRPATAARSSSSNGPSAAPGLAQDAWRWLIEGNWVAKVGIVLVLIALGAFFRFASQQGWLSFPMELRLAGVAAGAIAALWLGWRERERKRIFALNLQGGAIAVLLLTVFAAYRMYGLLPGGLTFGLLILLVGACSFLAIRQNSLGLAVFGLIGGFAAPILASTGQGSHVGLFSYYLLLNVGILAISWAKGWRVLNLLGFLFTFVIGTMWGVTRYRPEHLSTTEPFLIAFFLFYLAIPLMPAWRSKDPNRRDTVDGSLVFGTPLIAFGLQVALLKPDRDLLALSALALAIIYAALAWFVWQHGQLARWRKAYAGLSLVFATLVIPLAFDAQVTSAFWAIEGAALVWLGIAQDQRRLRWVGLLLQLFSAGALFVGGGVSSDAVLILNKVASTGLVLTIAGLFSATVYQRRESGNILSPLLVLWAVMWWFGIGFHEIDREVAYGQRTDVVMIFVAASALLFAGLRRLIGLSSLAWPAQLVLASAMMWVVVSAARHGAPFTDDGLKSLGLHFLLGYLTFWVLRTPWPRGLGWVHVMWWLAIPIALMLQIHHAFDTAPDLVTLGEGWRLAAIGLPILIGTALLLYRQDWVGLPLMSELSFYRHRLEVPVLALAGLGMAALLVSSGATHPLPFVPLFNPVELMQWLGLVLLWRWCRDNFENSDVRSALNLMLALCGFVMITVMTLRATHHFGGESWSPLMVTRSLPNAALSIVWTLLGIIGMLVGASRARRGWWIAGASILGMVVLKLLLVDMRLLGNMPGIVSLLTVGVLFVAVGYFAPMPPSATGEDPEPENEDPEQQRGDGRS